MRSSLKCLQLSRQPTVKRYNFENIDIAEQNVIIFSQDSSQYSK